MPARLSLALLAACTAQGPLAAPEHAPPTVVAPAPAPAATPEPATDSTVLSITAQWDDTPGADTITLAGDGRLVAGSAEGVARLPTAEGYVFGEQAKLEVVAFGHPKYARALVVAIPTTDEEDPANTYQVFVADGTKLRKIWDATVGTYGVVPLQIAGDGSIAYVEDGWTACQRAKFPEKVARDTVIFRLGKGRKLREAKRSPSGEVQECDELAACPFVYVLDAGVPALQGEILRNLRGAAAHAAQSLAIALPAGDVVRIRIAEEKPEVTRLDAIALVVDGVAISPRACDKQPAPSFCAADRAYAVLREGDALELEFDVPPGARAAELRAEGYYAVPRR